ncbi:glycosyltransferase family protein [Erythrobacter aurantius]|uniref:hypothetical protein n=1 Tax=Erythrobacter aurantius TaxID=2909249 RepID=UPI002079D643|nr:hypothetical protein [Erythrobacter aurantius]
MSAPILLCAAYGGGHVNACLPVAIAMAQKGWTVHFLALTTAYEKARHSRLQVWQARDLVADGEEEILDLGSEIAGEVPDHGPVSAQETYAYHGLGFHDLITQLGREKAEARYRERGRVAFEHGELARRIIAQVRPDIVLTTNSPRAEKAIIDTAQLQGIPAVVLNDTLASESNHWLHDPDYADRICVLSGPVRDVLIRSGHNPSKIVVTGNPAFASAAELRKDRAASSGSGSRRVLYASQPLPAEDAEHKQRVITELHRIAAKREDLELRVRLHPNEQARAAAGPTLAEDLLAADIVITHGSTVGIEAALAGIPVVLQMGSQIARQCRFEEYGIAMANEDVTELEMAIDRALALGVASQFSMPANSLGNVAAVLEEMIDYR